MNNAIVPILLISGIFIYLLPSIVAGSRDHRNVMPIVALNIFAGWTFVGWLASLIWSLTDNTEEQRTH